MSNPKVPSPTMLNPKVIARTLVAALLILVSVGCVTTTDSPFAKKASEEKAVQSHIQLGLAYIQSGDFVTAQKRLERALELDPKSPGAHAAMGLIYQRQGEPKLAEQSFKKALSYNAEFTRGRTYYAAFLYEKDRFAEAAEQLEIAGQDTSYEDRAQIFANLGLIYTRLEKLDEALQAYKRSLMLSRGQQPNVVLAMSRLKQMQGDHQQAWQYYNQYLDNVRSGRATHSPGSLSLGIELANKNGDRNTEASLALMLRNMFPNSPEAKNLQSNP